MFCVGIRLVSNYSTTWSGFWKGHPCFWSGCEWHRLGAVRQREQGGMLGRVGVQERKSRLKVIGAVVLRTLLSCRNGGRRAWNYCYGLPWDIQVYASRVGIGHGIYVSSTPSVGASCLSRATWDVGRSGRTKKRTLLRSSAHGIFVLL